MIDSHKHKPEHQLSSFVNRFGKQSDLYARFRPDYPAALVSYLALQTTDHDLAVDCATGSGQAAARLADHYSEVIGLEASPRQIARARHNDKVFYIVSRAENLPLVFHTADLVLVAQALHWLDLDLFFEEVRRVLKPGGIFAATSYTFLRIAPDIDRITDAFWTDVVGPYWSPRIKLLENHYTDISFPFEEMQGPSFTIEMRWALNDLEGYFHTWSATQKFMKVRGYDPLEDIRGELHRLWGDPKAKKPVRWPLHVKIGRAL